MVSGSDTRIGRALTWQKDCRTFSRTCRPPARAAQKTAPRRISIAAQRGCAVRTSGAAHTTTIVRAVFARQACVPPPRWAALPAWAAVAPLARARPERAAQELAPQAEERQGSARPGAAETPWPERAAQEQA